MSFNRKNAWFALLGASLVLGCDRALVDPPPPVPPPVPAIIVRITPASTTVVEGQSQTLTATVENDRGSSGVTWAIIDCAGGAAECGSLGNVTTTSVTYSAPATRSRRPIKITAASIANPAQVCSVAITITPALALEQITFIRQGDIYVVDGDGSNPIRLTTGGNHYTPLWSPDGSKIGFTSWHDGISEIGVLNADGSGLRILTPHIGADTTRDTFGGWSPDGSRIAFVRSAPTDSVVQYQDEDGSWYSYVVWRSDLYVMDADGSGVRQLPTQPGAVFSSGGAWFPDGRIAFAQGGDTYLMNRDGSGVTPFLDGGRRVLSWSPDGSTIAYTTGGNYYVMNADGSNVRQLTNLRGAPVLSADGTRLVFVTVASSAEMVWSSNWAVFALNTDDSGLKLIYSHSAGAGILAAGPSVGALLGGPAWSQDGSVVAVTIDADWLGSAAGGIAILKADGSNSWGVNNTAGASGAPAWRPHGAVTLAKQLNLNGPRDVLRPSP